MPHSRERAADDEPPETGRDGKESHGLSPMYWRWGASLAASFVAMYFLAFSQIDALDHFHLSLSVFWITVSMVSSMGLIMLVAMRPMLKNRRLNAALLAAFAVLLVAAFAGSRTEAFVENEAFLRSMIPHHSRAIHMCKEAALSDPEIIDLCGVIIETQREEIEIMERIMERRG